METVKTLSKFGLNVVLDKSEVFKDDPGNGTPAMVYNMSGASATYNCAVNEGELENNYTGNMNQLSEKQIEWLIEIESEINNFLEW